jgi:hypothetical protein
MYQKYSGSRNFISEHVDNHIWEDPVGTVITVRILEDDLVEVEKDKK